MLTRVNGDQDLDRIKENAMQILTNLAVVLGFTAVIAGWFVARRALDDQDLPTD